MTKITNIGLAYSHNTQLTMPHATSQYCVLLACM